MATKTKTSVTLSHALVREMDAFCGRHGNRSSLVEQAVRAYLDAQARQRRDARDLAILNRRADTLNREAADALSYQVDR